MGKWLKKGFMIEREDLFAVGFLIFALLCFSYVVGYENGEVGSEDMPCSFKLKQCKSDMNEMSNDYMEIIIDIIGKSEKDLVILI